MSWAPSSIALWCGDNELVGALTWFEESRKDRDRYLVSGGWDHTVRLWDLDSGSQLAKLEGHTQDVWSVAFSPDGHLAAAGGGIYDRLPADRFIRVWDLESGTFRDLRTEQAIHYLTFLPDGRLLPAHRSVPEHLEWAYLTWAEGSRAESGVSVLQSLPPGDYLLVRSSLDASSTALLASGTFTSQRAFTARSRELTAALLFA